MKLILEDSIGTQVECDRYKETPRIGDTVIFGDKQGEVEKKAFFYHKNGGIEKIVVNVATRAK